MLNWISSACIEQAGQAGPLYVNTTISMTWMKNVWELLVLLVRMGLVIDACRG